MVTQEIVTTTTIKSCAQTAIDLNHICKEIIQTTKGEKHEAFRSLVNDS